MGRTHTAKIHEELCCQRCMSVIHNHFECPACDTYRPGTDIYHDASVGDEIECDSCKAKFEILEMDNHGPGQSFEAKIERVWPDIDHGLARTLYEVGNPL